MKTYYAVSDVHGFFDELMTALNKNGFDVNNPDHILISCGDLLDRGRKPKECLEFAVNLHKQGRAILIQGNHESLMLELLVFQYVRTHDVHNGTDRTMYDLNGLDYGINNDSEAIEAMKNNELWNYYISHTVNYAEIGDNIFVHGWIPTKNVYVDNPYNGLDIAYAPIKHAYDKEWRNAPECSWEDSRWYNGMKMWHEGIKEPGKTIYCGHWHSSFGNANYHNDGKEFLHKIETYYIDPDTGKQEPHVNNEPFIDDGIVALDACTVISGIVNCIVIEEK